MQILLSSDAAEYVIFRAVTIFHEFPTLMLQLLQILTLLAEHFFFLTRFGTMKGQIQFFFSPSKPGMPAARLCLLIF